MKFKYYTNAYKLSENYPTIEDIHFEINEYLEKMGLDNSGFTYRIYNRIYNKSIITLDKFKLMLESDIEEKYIIKLSDKKYKLCK